MTLTEAKKMYKNSEINPAVKLGDKIILIHNRNNNVQYEKKVLTVTTQRNQRNKMNFTATKEGSSLNIGVYYTAPSDIFIMATKENIIENLKIEREDLIKQIKDTEIRIKTIEQEIEFQIKYDTEEEFVADKLNSLLDIHTNSKTKAAKIKAMAKVLEEMKKSNTI